MRLRLFLRRAALSMIITGMAAMASQGCAARKSQPPPSATESLGSGAASWVPSAYLNAINDALLGVPENHVEAVAAAQARLRELATLRPGDTRTETKIVNPMANYDHQFEVRRTSGIPEGVRVVPPTGRVFRHYSSLPVVDIIRQTRQLRAGKTPYIVMHPGVARELFVDLTGVFLTIPTAKAGSVGVGGDKSGAYVDFTLHDAIPVIEIERDSIFLIPLPPDSEGTMIPIIPR